MLKRHEDALSSRFDAVTRLGWACIHYWELYLWYGADRIGKQTWRDLQRRFNEENKGHLWIYENASERQLLLIHNDGLMTIADKLGEPEEIDSLDDLEKDEVPAKAPEWRRR